MKIEQQSTDGQLHKLKIHGTADDLRILALQTLDAIDNGKSKVYVGDTVIKIKCVSAT